MLPLLDAMYGDAAPFRSGVRCSGGVAPAMGGMPFSEEDEASQPSSIHVHAKQARPRRRVLGTSHRRDPQVHKKCKADLRQTVSCR